MRGSPNFGSPINLPHTSHKLPISERSRTHPIKIESSSKWLQLYSCVSSNLKNLICTRSEMNVARLVIVGRSFSPYLFYICIFLCILWISSSMHILHLENGFTHQNWGSGSPIIQIVWGNQGIWLTVWDVRWGLVDNKTCGSTRSNN